MFGFRGNYCADCNRQMAHCICCDATKPAAAPAVPGGFVIVPKASTLEMDSAGHDALLARGCMAAVSDAENCWNAMIEAWAAAPAASTPAAPAELLTIERIGQLIEQHTDRDFGLIVEPFARAIAADVASRCRAQGGVTNNTSSGNSAASTTGAAQTAEQVRDQALEEAAKAVEGVLWQIENGDGVRDEVYGAERCRDAIRALRPTPTHSSEAGAIQVTEGAGK